MSHTTDFIIIGHGLAGSITALEVEKRGYSYIVMDEEAPVTSSKIAAGMYSPINPKRMTLLWNYETFIPQALATYKRIEEHLSVEVLHQDTVVNALGSVKELNDLSLKEEDSTFTQFITNVVANPMINAPFGSFTINQSGWVNIPFLLQTHKQYLLQRQSYIQRKVVWNDVIQDEEGNWHLHGFKSKNVICCDGFNRLKNSFWSYIPPHATKGDELIIEAKTLPENHIWKKGIYLVPIGNHHFRVGATNDYAYKTEQPEEAAYNELKEKLDEMLNCPYAIIKHEAAIRPTSHDRMPIIGEHPAKSRLYIMNGLGTKGVLFAPSMANMLLDFIEKGTAIIKDVNVMRYKKYYVAEPCGE
jgi:glycine/D-amino acid oxidase-like deaminating enzyme